MPLFVDSTTWIAVGFAVGAALITLFLAVALVVFAGRGRRQAPAGTDVERLLSDSNARFEAMIADLGRALERARAEGDRSRQLSGISSTIDLDAVLKRALEAACALPGVDAGTIVIPQRDGGPLVATLGMSSEEAARQPVAGPPDGRRARAVGIHYRYDEEQLAEDGELLRGGMAVPLRGEDAEVIGTLAVFWRGTDREPAEEELSELEHLAATAGPSIENARRFREARQLADLDALTSLHNRRYFHETLAREVARAQRYDRRLALVVFDIDDFKAINDRVGHLAGDAVLGELAERVQSVVRSADIACRVGGDEFAVILPESTLADAEQLYRRLQFAVAARPTASADRLRLSAGIGELRPEDDPISFFERADHALYQAKEAGKGQSITVDNAG
jgi:diguanylate cyclase (GGDEF)-like protein